jgi:propanol-preferring alcohol dehydrogenase
MKAMILKDLCALSENQKPLQLTDIPVPEYGEHEVLVRISVCGVCHTELDEIEGRTPPPRLPVIPGHQAVGVVEKSGEKVTLLKKGDRVGIAWIYSACGRCDQCLQGRENLCPDFLGTGRDANGGYAEYMTVHERYAHRIPQVFSDAEAAPLLCAGAIGYRSLRLSGHGSGQSLGLTGFGASAHLVLKMVKHKYPESRIYVFARSEKERAFAVELGALWSGDTDNDPPEKLDSIIDTTPAWKPVVRALACLKPGGRLVINAIRKEESDKESLLKIDYASHLWFEKEIKSVANVETGDVREFLALAAEIQIRPEIQEFPLEQANRALVELKQGRIRGAKVLRIN